MAGPAPDNHGYLVLLTAVRDYCRDGYNPPASSRIRKLIASEYGRIMKILIMPTS